MLLRKLAELYSQLDKHQFELLMDIAKDDINFGVSVGTIYTEVTVIGVIDNALEVIKKL